MPNDAFESSLGDWLNWLRVDKSLVTVKGYEWELRALGRVVPGKGPFDFRTADLTRYLAERRLAGAADATLKRSVAAMRSFFGFVCGKKSPALKVPFPRVKSHRQRTLNDDQALAVLSSCDTSTPGGARDLALLCLLLDTGLRAGELCRLRVRDVDLGRRQLTVAVKGGHEADGVFSSSTAAYLAAWMALRPRYAGTGVEAFFVAIGGSTRGKGFTTGGLRAIFRHIGARAGLEKFSPHDLRRTFATLALRRGAPTRVVQVAGRWEDVRMVEHYSQAIEARDFDRYSPVQGILGT